MHAPHEFDVTIVGAGPVGLALAAWLAGKLPPISGDTVIICSGSNVDPVAYARVMSEG